MRRPGKNKKGTGSLAPEKTAQNYAQDVIQDLLTFLAQSGFHPEALREICQTACDQLSEPEESFDPAVVPYLTHLPQIMAYWNSDPEFKDPQGHPLKLPLRSKLPILSLETLIRRVFPTEDLLRVIDSLLRVGAIRKTGDLYESLERSLMLSDDPPTVHVHTLLSVAGMMRTVRNNLAAGTPDSRLLERSAAIPCVPLRALPEIHARAKREFDAQLWKFDSYVRTQTVEPGSEPTTCVAIGVYVYEDPPSSRIEPSRTLEEPPAAQQTRTRRRRRRKP